MGIRENIDNINEKIKDGVKLVAVSKTRTCEEIMEAYEHGIRDFGENKVQELILKYEELPKDIKWHLIGHLQRNKVKYIVGKTFLIHSLDNIPLLEEIERQYAKEDIVAEVLIEINIGRETSKTGILLENLEELLQKVMECSHVKVLGLMAIIPPGDERSCRSYFKEMYDLFCKLKERNIPNINMKYLSMGMTSDYQYAVLEKSNMVRIGEGIFGKRIYLKNK